MSSGSLERDDEAKFVEFCKSIGVQCRKLKLFNENAWPDRTLLYSGSVMFMEFKKKGERPSPLQQYTLDELSSSGFYAIWVDNLEEAKFHVLRWRTHVDRTSAGSPMA